MTLEKQIAEDYGMVLKEAQSMGCNKINALYNIPLDNMKAIVNALEEVEQYRTIGTVEECRETVDKINYYQNLLGKKVWWIDGLGNRVESTINCFYIEQGIEGVRCELLNCTVDAEEIGKSIHVISNKLRYRNGIL